MPRRPPRRTVRPNAPHSRRSIQGLAWGYNLVCAGALALVVACDPPLEGDEVRTQTAALAAPMSTLYECYARSYEDYILTTRLARCTGSRRIAGSVFSPGETKPLDTVALHSWVLPRAGSRRADYRSSTHPIWRGHPGDRRGAWR